MKRVLIFSLSYFPHVGGAEIAIKEITNRIQDIEFHLLTLNFGGETKKEKIGNIFVHRVGESSSYLQKILFIPRAAATAARLHREHHFDLFWVMMSYMLFPVVLLRLVGLRIPYILTLQEGDPWEHMFNRWFILPFRPLLKYGFKHTSAVQAISTYLAGWARSMGYQGETLVIPNGYIDPQGHTDIEWFFTDMSGQNREIFWEKQHKIKTSPSNKILITTSRLVHKNAIDVVIEAMPLLPKDFLFMILGAGQDKKKLEDRSRQLNVSDRVYFLGEVKNTAVLYHLNASNIFIRPSRSEGMGNSFIEAMAVGIPVIGTQEGGIADFLFDAKRNPDREPTGWAVDKDSPEQIAEAVSDIMSNPEQVKLVVANARKSIFENYDWKLIATNMKNLFDRLQLN